MIHSTVSHPSCASFTKGVSDPSERYLPLTSWATQTNPFSAKYSATSGMNVYRPALSYGRRISTTPLPAAPPEGKYTSVANFTPSRISTWACKHRSSSGAGGTNSRLVRNSQTYLGCPWRVVERLRRYRPSHSLSHVEPCVVCSYRQVDSVL